METPQSSNVNLVARPSQQLLEQGLCPQLQFERACLRGIDWEHWHLKSQEGNMYSLWKASMWWALTSSKASLRTPSTEMPLPSVGIIWAKLLRSAGHVSTSIATRDWQMLDVQDFEICLREFGLSENLIWQMSTCKMTKKLTNWYQQWPLPKRPIYRSLGSADAIWTKNPREQSVLCCRCLHWNDWTWKGTLHFWCPTTQWRDLQKLLDLLDFNHLMSSAYVGATSSLLYQLRWKTFCTHAVAEAWSLIFREIVDCQRTCSRISRCWRVASWGAPGGPVSFLTRRDNTW